ncbi:Ldh family oxidoreductase [Nocardioides bigeumensis]|uniref:Ldh family oxidoreductase n=1 Tax=Nocardioides bigeumensis TaxID=433657 RepID=A0ABN2XKT3_9ACTN
MTRATVVAVDELRDRLTRLLSATVLSETDAVRLAAYFVDAEVSGRTSHGLQRLAGLLAALEGLDGPTRLETRQHGPSAWSVEANGAPGLLAAQRAVELAMASEATSVAAVGVTGFAGTTGALGHFTDQVARGGRIGLCMVACESGVAPVGGIDPVLGTNPLAVSFPTDADPVTVDISTAAVSYGTLQLLARAGRPAPEGTVIDSAGRSSTDPLAADSGAQLPMAAHKGYGLGLVVELLAGAMLGAKVGRLAAPGTDGLLLVVAPVDQFRPRDLVMLDAGRLVEELRDSRPADPAHPVRVPGDRAAKARHRSHTTGTVSLDASLWDDLLARTGGS